MVRSHGRTAGTAGAVLVWAILVLPFTQAQFLENFGQYHAGVGVWQAFVLMFGVVALSFAFWANRAASRVVTACLAVLWLSMGLVYHWGYFSRINPSAKFFAIVFCLQAAIFIWAGWRSNALRFKFQPSLSGWLGSLVMLYALAGYLVVNFAVRHYYPSAPWFGVPGPTVIFTLGLLMWSNARLDVMAVPLAWAVVGMYEAVNLHVPQDYGLAVAALLALVVPRRIQ